MILTELSVRLFCLQWKHVKIYPFNRLFCGKLHMFWIVLIIILLLAIAGLFFIRAQSEREWVREVSEW